jgi:hypothetical protein
MIDAPVVDRELSEISDRIIQIVFDMGAEGAAALPRPTSVTGVKI